MPTWPLDRPLVAVFLGLVAAVLLLRSAPRLGAHRGRAVGSGLLALTIAAYLNAYFAYMPQVGDLAGPRPWPVVTAQAISQPSPGLVGRIGQATSQPRGAVVSLPLAGAVSGAPTRRALIYLPPQYFSQPQRRFPVLYLLHGSPGVPLDWFRGGKAAVAGLAAARAGLPVILVAPKMSSSWLADSECVDGPKMRAETYLVDDVVPAVDRTLRTLPRAADRGLLGNSAGGYCSLSLALRHPELFSQAAALSPLTRPTYAYGTLADLFGRRPDLSRVIAEHTPGWLLVNRPLSRRVRLYLDVGDADPVRPAVLRFAALSTRLGGDVQLRVREGGHTYQVWRPALVDAIRWFAAGAAPRSQGVG